MMMMTSIYFLAIYFYDKTFFVLCWVLKIVGYKDKMKKYISLLAKNPNG